jgi:hypothetical protein
MSERLGAVRLMVSAADKPAKAVLLREKNTVPWLISHKATSAFIYQAFIQKIWSPGTMYQSSMRSALAWPPKLPISPIPPCVLQILQGTQYSLGSEYGGNGLSQMLQPSQVPF